MNELKGITLAEKLKLAKAASVALPHYTNTNNPIEFPVSMNKANERIKELALRAGIAVWGDAVYMYDPKDTLDSTVMEKFAELIVRECADIGDKAYSDIGKYGYIGEKIKEHFGVEE